MAKEKFDGAIINPFVKSLRTLGITSDEITEAMYDLRLDLPPLDVSIKTQLEDVGFEIAGDIFSNEDIIFSAPHEYILFKKRPVLIYIRDQYIKPEDYAAGKFNKFHVCFCKALENAKMQHRFNSRYVVTTNMTGKFFVNVAERYSNEYLEEGVYKRLEICQDCLREINWKNFNRYCGGGEEWYRGGSYRGRRQIVERFSIDEFLKSVRQNLFNRLEEMPPAHIPKKQYTLSQRFKDELKYRRGYKCEQCGKVTVKSDLHIHHRNHNEGDNSASNLMVVCVECHKKIHRAEGGYVGDMK